MRGWVDVCVCVLCPLLPLISLSLALSPLTHLWPHAPEEHVHLRHLPGVLLLLGGREAKSKVVVSLPAAEKGELGVVGMLLANHVHKLRAVLGHII